MAKLYHVFKYPHHRIPKTIAEYWDGHEFSLSVQYIFMPFQCIWISENLSVSLFKSYLNGFARSFIAYATIASGFY